MNSQSFSVTALSIISLVDFSPAIAKPASTPSFTPPTDLTIAVPVGPRPMIAAIPPPQPVRRSDRIKRVGVLYNL